jgi:hypothetical protein
VVTLLCIGGFLLAAVVLVKRWFGRSAEAQAREIVRRGLKEFNDRLHRDIHEGRRPFDHLALTRHMCGILSAAEAMPATRPGADHLAVLEPTAPLDRMACEELVGLGRLQRTARPGMYLPAPRRPVHDRPEHGRL